MKIVEPYDWALVSQGAGSGAENLKDILKNRIFTADGVTAQMVIDLGSAKPVDSIALLGTNQVTGGTWTVQASNNSDVANNVQASFTGPLLAKGQSRSNETHCILHFTSATYRYWRFELSGTPSVFTARYLVIGDAFEPDMNFSRDTNLRPVTEGIDSASGAGDFSPVDLSTRVDLNLVLQLRWTELLTYMLQLYSRVGASKPVFVNLQPENAQREHAMLFYGTFPRNWSGNQFSQLNRAVIPLSMRGLI